MKRIWIIKGHPDDRNPPNKGRVNDTLSSVYHSVEEAEGRARGLCRKTRNRYVVFEAVKCFDPASTVEVPVEVVAWQGLDQ